MITDAVGWLRDRLGIKGSVHLSLDLFVRNRGCCGRLCPVGDFYSLPGRWSPVRVSTPQCSERNDCMDSMDCIDVCSKDIFAFGPRFNNPPSTDPLGRPAD